MCCENLLVYHLSSLCYADTSFLGAHYRCLHHQLFIESVLSNVSALDYDAAMADDYVDEWRKAAKKEVEQLEAHGTWVLDEVSNATSRILPEYDFSLDLVRFVPNLRKLDCPLISSKGSLNDLFCVRDTLQELRLKCPLYCGTIGDLRDFPLLERLDFHCQKHLPATPGLCDSGLPSLKEFHGRLTLACVSDAPLLMHFLFARNMLSTCCPTIRLHKSSPDQYNPDRKHLDLNVPEPQKQKLEFFKYPQFSIETVQVGSRLGWRWYCGKKNALDHPYFETHWLINEPQAGAQEHLEHCENVERTTKQYLGPFVGLYEPPKTEHEYESLVIAYIKNNRK